MWNNIKIELFKKYRESYSQGGNNMNNKNNHGVNTNINKKTEYNNQWTNNNTKYYPDNRERRDGPGGSESSTVRKENCHGN